jgi:hypothetical protein
MLRDPAVDASSFVSVRTRASTGKAVMLIATPMKTKKGENLEPSMLGSVRMRLS